MVSMSTAVLRCAALCHAMLCRRATTLSRAVSAKFRRFVICEWLYSAIDRGFFLRNEFQETLVEFAAAEVRHRRHRSHRRHRRRQRPRCCCCCCCCGCCCCCCRCLAIWLVSVSLHARHLIPVCTSWRAIICVRRFRTSRVRSGRWFVERWAARGDSVATSFCRSVTSCSATDWTSDWCRRERSVPQPRP